MKLELQGTWKAVSHWMLAVGANLSTSKDVKQHASRFSRCGRFVLTRVYPRFLLPSGCPGSVRIPGKIRVTSEPRIAGAQDSVQSPGEWRQGLEKLAYTLQM